MSNKGHRYLGDNQTFGVEHDDFSERVYKKEDELHIYCRGTTESQTW